ncbi:MAG: hypothetical protein AB8U44_01745 [Aaplasma endosymbiont of Hyalomma asiaticum]
MRAAFVSVDATTAITNYITQTDLLEALAGFLSEMCTMSGFLKTQFLPTGDTARLKLTPEKLACSCRVHSDEIDSVMENVPAEARYQIASDLLRNLVFRDSVTAELQDAFFLALAFIPAGEKREKVLLASYKVLKHHRDDNVLKKLRREDMTTLVSMIDLVVNGSGIDAENAEQRQKVFEEKFASDSASFAEKLVSSILPGAGTGVSGAVKGMVDMIKDKLGTQDSSGKSTNEICLDLVSSPVGAFMMLAMTCITGSTGLALVTLPVFTCWKVISASRAVAHDLEVNMIDKALRTAAPRLFTVEDCDFQASPGVREVGSVMTETKYDGFANSRGISGSR